MWVQGIEDGTNRGNADARGKQDKGAGVVPEYKPAQRTTDPHNIPLLQVRECFLETTDRFASACSNEDHILTGNACNAKGTKVFPRTF